MTLDNFVLWKFRKVEGILENFRASDVFVSKYSKGFHVFYIKYDLEKLQATITSPLGDFADITCSFKDLEQTLKDMGYYKLKDPSECHSCALQPWNGKMEI